MQYKLLASDYDNTLVPFGETQPRAAVVQAVCRMQAAGAKFVLSTGRVAAAVRLERLGGIRPDYIIACNGAYVADSRGTCVAEHPLTNEEMYALVDFCEDHNYPLQFAFRDGYYAYTEYEYLRWMYGQKPGSGLTVQDGEDQDRHLADMPYAAFVLLPAGGLQAFAAKYGHLGLLFMQVGPENIDGYACYDVVRAGLGKGVGLADLCRAEGITLQQAVAAGDSANDISMLQAAGLGVCMANGTAEAKAAANRIIGDVREDGLAALIAELWLGGPKAQPGAALAASPWGLEQ